MKFICDRALVLFILIANLSNSKATTALFELQHPDTVRTELQALFQELSIKHPGFYRYNDSVQFNHYIDSTLNTINQPLTELDILRKVKPIIAKIGCLHTGIGLSETSEAALNQKPNFLPFALFYENGKAKIWQTFANNSLKIDDEIKAINGVSIAQIYQQLLTNIPMDGFNTTGKYKLLTYTFPNWYRTIIDTTTQFNIQLTDGRTETVKGVYSSEVLQYQDIVNQPITLRVIEDIGVLKIPSFANSYLKSKGQKFKKEITSAFKQLNKQNITKLLIDVRGNSGGSDSNPALLSAYFFDKPYQYWQRIEITEALAKEFSGMSRVFYGKPKYENGMWLWSGKGLTSGEFQFTDVQQPADEPFQGQVFILTDGLCMSSCADFTAIMQANQKAIVIGEETGGGYQGNTSGLIPTEELQSGLLVDVPLLKYVNAVPSDKNVGRGTIPDIELNPTFDDWQNEENYLKKVLERLR